MALFTLLPAAFPYLRPPDFLREPEPFFFAAMVSASSLVDSESPCRVVGKAAFYYLTERSSS
jgi:hypothetical protein